MLNQIPFVFLPGKERRVRRDGVHFENVRYWHPVFSAWAIRRKMLLILIRYDPQDLSRLYARGSKGEILEIPYAEIRNPPVSIWELRAASAHLRKVSKTAVNETRLFTAITQQRSIVEEAQRSTRRARKAAGGRPSKGKPSTRTVPAAPQNETAAPPASADPVENLEPYPAEVWSD